MHMSIKFYSSAPSNNVAVRHYLEGFILVLGKKIIVLLGHNSSKYGISVDCRRITLQDRIAFIMQKYKTSIQVSGYTIF